VEPVFFNVIEVVEDIYGARYERKRDKSQERLQKQAGVSHHKAKEQGQENK
jgi:hypothetical protein